MENKNIEALSENCNAINVNEKCRYYEISRSQRAEELARGLTTSGTMGYETMGCYGCEGYRINCPSYFSGIKK